MQDNHEWTDGDFIIVHDNVLTILGDDTITSLSKDLYQYSVSGEIKKLTPLKQCIWLPRIDQLITLSDEGWRQFVEMCDYETFNASPTLEIRGLERIMHIKYNKSWNGVDWI